MNAETLVQIGQNLDPQVYLRILESYKEQAVFDKQFLLKEQIFYLLKTRQFDQIKAVAKELNITHLDKVVDAQQQLTNKQIERIQNKEGIQQFLSAIDKLQGNKFTRNQIEQFYNNNMFSPLIELAKVFYDQAQYEKALKILNCLFCFFEEDPTITVNLLLGKLNTEIMLENYQDAKQSLYQLNNKLSEEAIQDESAKEQKQAQIQKYCKKNYQLLSKYRAQFLHAALYVFVLKGTYYGDNDKFFEYATSQSMLSSIQYSCQYLFKYIAVSLVQKKAYQQYHGDQETKNFFGLMKEKAIQYNDCWIQYLSGAQTEFNFQKSKETIQQVQNDIKNDIFIQKNQEKLINQAKILFFQNYCKLYTNVSIKNVANFLGTNEEDAEIWFYNLIRTTNIEAKIDSDTGIIEIGRKPQNFNEKISAKLRDLIPRTNILCNNLIKLN